MRQRALFAVFAAALIPGSLSARFSLLELQATKLSQLPETPTLSWNLGSTGIFKKNDWNHVKIEAVGDSIKTTLNGKPCADIKDSQTLRGFIALQVHGIGKDKSKIGLQVRWRNLKITELTGDSAPAAK